MATAAAIRERIYSNLYGSFPTDAPFVTTLTATYTDAEGVIDVLDEDDWAAGDVMENTATGELMKVLSVTTDSSHVVTVSHGWNGTTTAAAVASDDVLFKNPRFTQKKLDDAVTAVLLSLEGWGVHAFGTGSITRADPVILYDLSETDIVESYGILKFYRAEGTSEIMQMLPFKFFFNLDTSESEWTQSNQLAVLSFGSSADTDALYFTYAQQILLTTDLAARQEEIVVAGATASVLGGAIAPATQDPGARTDRTVQPGQVSRDVRFFQGQFFTGVRAEAALVTVARQKQMQEAVWATRSRRWRA